MSTLQTSWDGKTDRWFDHNDDLHRLDGPAVVQRNSWHTYEAWYVHGQTHRTDGPAITYRYPEYTYCIWYLFGKMHRFDGPAIHRTDNQQQEWYQHGKLHRLRGPAIIHANGIDVEYYIEGHHLIKEEFLARRKQLGEAMVSPVC